MNFKQEGQKQDSILPGLVFLCIGLFIGSTAAIQDHIRRSYLGPNKPVRIVINIPVAGGRPGEDVHTTLHPADPDEVTEFEKWMAEAEKIVAKTKDSEAKAVLQFLKERAMLATPLPNGTIQLHAVPKHPQWIAVLPFMQRHKVEVPDWDKTFFYQHDSAVGYFAGGKDTPTRLIVLRAFDNLGDFTKGVTVLHEGWHAHDILTRDKPLSVKRGSYAYQHKELWFYEDRLTKLFGDPDFSKLMEKEKNGDLSSFDSRCEARGGRIRPELEKAFAMTGDSDISFVCDSMERLVWPSKVAY